MTQGPTTISFSGFYPAASASPQFGQDNAQVIQVTPKALIVTQTPYFQGLYTIQAIDVATGSTLWNRAVEGSINSGVISTLGSHGNVSFIQAQHAIWAMDAPTGTLLWSQIPASPQWSWPFSPPVQAGTTTFVAVGLGSSAPALLAVDAKSGTELGTWSLGSRVIPTPLVFASRKNVFVAVGTQLLSLKPLH